MEAININTKKVLIADDDPGTCQLLFSLFRQRGYDAITANNGREAIVFADLIDPDLIFLDAMMPDMDGWEVMRRLNGSLRSPVILMSEFASRIDETQSLELGAKDYIRKPFKTEELLAKTDALLFPEKSNILQVSQIHKPIDLHSIPKVIAIVPAYNEERSIGSLILNLRSFITNIIVVDDGSTDSTTRIAKAAGAIVVAHDQNQGKGVALNTGIRIVRKLSPDAVVTMDADGQHNPSEIEQVIDPVLKGEADIVIGSRYLRHESEVPVVRILGHRFFNLVSHTLSRTRSTDSQSGFRALSPRAIEKIEFTSSGFSVESEMQFLAHEYDLKLVEVPITITYHDAPKRSVIVQGSQVLNGILRLTGQYRPMLFFGLPGLVGQFFGVLLGVYVIQHYIATQELNLGLSLISGFIILMGALALFTGVSLHSFRSLIRELMLSKDK